MADKSLIKVYFPILRKTSGDSKRAVDDPYGYFSCRASVARFLKIQDLAKETLTVGSKKRETYLRSLILADGTKLSSSTSGSTQVAESEVPVSVSSRGSRTVIIRTGKEIASSTQEGATNPKSKRYHTISFRFPGWATVWVIADALGTIIPSDHIKLDPGADDILPYFTVKGGRKYPIMAKSDATSSPDAQVATNPQEAASLANQADIKTKKAAGG